MHERQCFRMPDAESGPGSAAGGIGRSTGEHRQDSAGVFGGRSRLLRRCQAPFEAPPSLLGRGRARAFLRRFSGLPLVRHSVWDFGAHGDGIGMVAVSGDQYSVYSA